MARAHLARYVAHLARRLKPQSIAKYLNIVRLLHIEADFPNPLEDNWVIKSLLTGIKRAKGQAVKRKLPITPDILLRIHKRLDLSQPQAVVFWAISLLAFFSLLRKSNLLPATSSAFSPAKHLRRCDFSRMPWGLAVQIRWTKTIQFQERHFQIPLPALPGHPLCPVKAILAAFSLTPSADPQGPAFLIPGFPSYPLLYNNFISILRSHLSHLNLPADEYAGHSFRRGGASWAFRMLLPTEAIKAMGDWSSDAYLAYLEIPLSSKVRHAQIFARGLPSIP